MAQHTQPDPADERARTAALNQILTLLPCFSTGILVALAANLLPPPARPQTPDLWAIRSRRTASQKPKAAGPDQENPGA